MKGISTRGIYALASMHVLYHSPRCKAMRIKEISAMTQISHSYLEQILSALRQAGLVKSIRGAKGGYVLAKSADEISVLEILEALEGDLWHIEGNVGASVILQYFWQEMQLKMQKVFEVKLSQLDQSFQPFFYEI
jgi:Rrf2 family protein